MFAVASIKKIKYDKVVIGSTPEAIAYAKKHKIPVVLPNEECPFRFDTYGDTVKIEFWSKDLWEMGLEGMNPFGDLVNQITVDEEKIRVTYDNINVVDLEYEDCYLFETENGVKHDLTVAEERDSLYRVVDWFAVDRCEKHKEENIRTNDDFIKEIIFYPSDRIDGNHEYKDIAAVSYLSEDQLTEFDFSDTMAVFKVRHHMLEHDIKGRVSYYDKKGIAHRYKVRLRPTSRETELIPSTLYHSTDKVHFCGHMGLKDILGGQTP